MSTSKAQADYVVKYSQTHNLSYGQALFQLERGLADRSHVIRYQKLQAAPVPQSTSGSTRRDRHEGLTTSQLTGSDGLISRLTGEDDPYEGRLHVVLHHGQEHLGDLVLKDDGTVEAHTEAGHGPAIDLLRRTFQVNDEEGLRRMAEEMGSRGDSETRAVLIEGRGGHVQGGYGAGPMADDDGLEAEADALNKALANQSQALDELGSVAEDQADDDLDEDEEGDYYRPRRDHTEDDRDGPILRYRRPSHLDGPMIQARRGEDLYFSPPIE